MSPFSPSVANDVAKPVGWMTASSISWMDTRSSTMRTEGMAERQGSSDVPGRGARCQSARGSRLLEAARDGTELEDRQEHRHDDATNDPPEKDDEHGLD